MPATTRSASKKTTPNDVERPHVQYAPPPWHSVALVVLMLAVFIKLLPSFESLDQVATIETFTVRLFPSLVSLRTMVCVRFGTCIVMVGTQVHAIFDKNRPPVTPTYLPLSKLKRHVTVSLAGFRILLPFTSWAWTLLETSFGLSAWISWKALIGQSQDVQKGVLRMGILLFEAAAPTALLVAFVVRYGIWPQALADTTRRDPTAAFKTPRALLWHNGNVIMALIEVSLLGGLPVRYADLSVSALFGLVYVLFTWSVMHFWEPSAGPQFLYFFFDTTLGKTTSIALVVLLLVLLVFYALFCGIHQILDHLGGGPLVHGVAVVVISSTVCRFRD